MIVDITGRNYEISEHLRNVTEQKLAKLDKYFDNLDTKAKVAVKKNNKDVTTEIMLDYAGKLVRATQDGDNPYDNLDLVLPKLEGQIRKHRTRFDQSSKNKAYREQATFVGEDKIENSKNDVVKQKQFRLVPMTVKEAQDEMELLGHSFYVFLEIKSNTIQVLYKRNDGDLGLIIPQI